MGEGREGGREGGGSDGAREGEVIRLHFEVIILLNSHHDSKNS